MDDDTFHVFSLLEVCHTFSAQGVSVLSLMPFWLTRVEDLAQHHMMCECQSQARTLLQRPGPSALSSLCPMDPSLRKAQGSFKPCHLQSLNGNGLGYYFSAVCPHSF